jgi:hypothetical protein
MGGDVKLVLELFEICVVDFHFGGSICKVLQLKNGCFVLIHVSNTSWFLNVFNCGHCNYNRTNCFQFKHQWAYLFGSLPPLWKIWIHCSLRSWFKNPIFPYKIECCVIFLTSVGCAIVYFYFRLTNDDKKYEFFIHMLIVFVHPNISPPFIY